ncbi:MAG: alpha/beta hydrolase-fold protein [Capsulimonadales bacterium]|nr:alpha/beta hydrolase-fold protein [Capsulimonadales bacterium]
MQTKFSILWAFLGIATVAGRGSAQTPPPVPAASVPHPVPHSLTGNVLLFRDFPAKRLPARTVAIYLPPGYHRPSEKNRRYPVLYLQDGQNLFDGATAFLPGKEWRVDETADRLIRANRIEPILIVGIYNSGMERINEYSPQKDRKYGGGKADAYGDWLCHELKPFIDRHFRTGKAPEQTAIGGSSLGGLVSLYLALRHPATFGRAAVLSPSVWWADRAILSAVRTTPRTPLKIWLDIGTAEGENALPDARLLRDALRERGWQTGVDLQYLEAEGAKHNEEAWAARVEPMLRFLFSKP